ncbi:metal-dependent hydrolase [Dermatophilus congolensis]|uniref:Metal-dependent hydrolase n=1 Tax=Dermatophilus congolensis TaxID=1863 RepID=A0AA46BMS6_9MICO|nr:MBL fold metallo-hydrolase [Dermatophilus congolensis]STD08241.1 metal-dependent hydrolase [Dermatophilus congolensis]
MRITRFGHSCVLFESQGARILVDPGVFSCGFEDVRDLDAVVVTHEHPDHVDVDRLAGLMEANPQAQLFSEAGLVRRLRAECGVETVDMAPGELFSVGTVMVEPVGNMHAVIYRTMERVRNTGLVLREQGGAVAYHPGDALDVVPDAVDVLCVPIAAPWSAMKETIDWVARCGARRLVPIHDGILSAGGREIFMRQIANLSVDVNDDPREWIVDAMQEPVTV